jgi:hypothetical protein
VPVKLRVTPGKFGAFPHSAELFELFLLLPLDVSIAAQNNTPASTEKLNLDVFN